MLTGVRCHAACNGPRISPNCCQVDHVRSCYKGEVEELTGPQLHLYGMLDVFVYAMLLKQEPGKFGVPGPTMGSCRAKVGRSLLKVEPSNLQRKVIETKTIVCSLSSASVP